MSLSLYLSLSISLFLCYSSLSCLFISVQYAICMVYSRPGFKQQEVLTWAPTDFIELILLTIYCNYTYIYLSRCWYLSKIKSHILISLSSLSLFINLSVFLFFYLSVSPLLARFITKLFRDVLRLNDDGAVIIDDAMRTNHPGMFNWLL